MKNLTVRSVIMGVIGLSVLGLMLPPAAHAETLTPEQLTQRVKSISTNASRLDNVETGLKVLQQETNKLGRLLDNRAMLEMMQRVDDLSEEISLLRGEIEQQGHDVTEIKKRQRELYLDIDRRLRDLESRTTSQLSTPQPVIVPKVTAPAITPEIEPIVNTPIAPPVVQPKAKSAPETSQPVTTSSEERAAYQAAFDTLKEGRYKKAKTEFKAFLQKYPDSSFAGNAQYWLGEANYVTRNFEQGIIEFELVLSKYPGSNKVADAMLKLGYTYYEIRQFEQAKATLVALQNQFPKTTAARLGTKRLNRMIKEGH